MNEEDFKNENPETEENVEPVVETTETIVSDEEPVTDSENESTESVSGKVTGVVSGCSARLAIRKEPNDDADVVRLIPASEKVTVDLSKSTDDWYRVSTETGIGGYCMKKFVTIK